MKRMTVKSSTIKSIGYDNETEILEVEFIRETIYQYERVNSEIVLGLLFSDSLGSYFNKYIAKSFNYKKIGERVK